MIIKKNKQSLLLLILIFLGMLYYFKGIFVAAIVNGKPISRLRVIKELEIQAGKKVLDTLITESLVKDAAKKQNITITDSELNDELQKIEKSLLAQKQDLNEALKAQGLTRESLKEQIKLQKIIEKLFAKDIKVSGKEVQDFIEKNKTSIPEGENESSIKKQAQMQLAQEKLSQKFQSWITDQRTKSNIIYFMEQ